MLIKGGSKKSITESGSLRFFCMVFVSMLILVELHAVNHIEWEPVDGADHYQIVLRQNGEQVFVTRSDVARLPVLLAPGDYEFRVDVIDPFDNIVVSSSWNPLTILIKEPPFIVDYTPDTLFADESIFLKIRVSGFVSGEKESTRFHIEDNQGIMLPLEIVSFKEHTEGLERWTSVSLASPQQQPSEGSWHLIMTNPSGSTYRVAKAFVLEKRLKPHITRLRPSTLQGGGKDTRITIIATGLEENAEVHFDGPSEIGMTFLKKLNKDSLSYSLDLTQAAHGWYSVTVSNPSGKSDRKDLALKITPPSIDDYEKLEFDTRNPKPLPKYPHSLHIGYMANIPIGESQTFFDEGFLGFKFGYYQKFFNNFIRKIPVLRDMGWGIGFLLSTAPRLQLLVSNTTTYQFILFLGIHYLTSFDSPLNMLLHTAVGVSYSFHNSPDVSRQTNIDEFSLASMDTLDLIWRIGIGLRIDFTPRFFSIISLDGNLTFYANQPMWSMHPQVEVGLAL